MNLTVPCITITSNEIRGPTKIRGRIFTHLPKIAVLVAKNYPVEACADFAGQLRRLFRIHSSIKSSKTEMAMPTQLTCS